MRLLVLESAAFLSSTWPSKGTCFIVQAAHCHLPRGNVPSLLPPEPGLGTSTLPLTEICLAGRAEISASCHRNDKVTYCPGHEKEHLLTTKRFGEDEGEICLKKANSLHIYLIHWVRMHHLPQTAHSYCEHQSLQSC